MLNRVVLVGRLTKDPDLRYTPNGVAVANFTLAVNRPFKNQSGESEADFINCVVWRKPAENLANYMSKGSLVGVDGRVQTRSFDNQEGNRVYVTEIVADSVQFLESKGGSGGTNQSNNSNYNNSGGQSSSNNSNQNDRDPFKDKGEPIEISDDDLPF
ncbi:single-stranded DNA-binding protein [Terribacillus sp. JSM ZJ617]|uniref:single-stranded DNA-binding protein n=1 Tax=Terribacillus sp. JSM ZJ617 TaxID=3342119 RepID=UPI0035A85E31